MDKNIVLIVLDALRADMLGCYGSREGLSPNLDKLAQEGILYKNAYASSTFTPSSMLSILGGVYSNKYNQYLPNPAKNKLISSSLQSAGYKTYAFSSNPFISSFYGYNHGWDEFKELGSKSYVWLDFLSNAKIIGGFFKALFEKLAKFYYWLQEKFFYFDIFFVYPHAKKINQAVINFLDQEVGQNKFFLYLHYMDNHSPYLDLLQTTNISVKRQGRLNRLILSHDKKLKKQINEHDIEDIKELYKSQARYTDKYIGELIAYFKKKGLYENTVFIITSDHGEELFEEGFHNHRGRFTDTLLKVPLIIIDQQHKSVKIDNNVSNKFIAYSIMKLLGANNPYGKEVNLFDLDEVRNNHQVYYEVMRRADNWMSFVGPFNDLIHDKLYGVSYGKANLTLGPGEVTTSNIGDRETKKLLLNLLRGHIKKESNGLEHVLSGVNY